MDKTERDSILTNKDIPAITKGSLLYTDSTALRSLVLAIPICGSQIDLLLNKRGNDFVTKRLQTFITELQEQLKTLQSQVLKADDEALFDLLQIATEEVSKTRSNERIKQFSRVVSNYLTKNVAWDEANAAMRILSDITELHIRILQYAINLPLSKEKVTSDLQVFYVDHMKKGNTKPLIFDEFPNISESTLRMYCSELVAKGLLHDEGIGRWGRSNMQLLTPTSMTNWLLDTIASANKK
jgi:hypothetical protein